MLGTVKSEPMHVDSILQTANASSLIQEIGGVHAS